MRRSVVSRLAVMGIAVPAIAGLVGAVLQVIWSPQVPHPIAIHWGVGGEPDGSGPLALTVVLTLVLTLAMPLWIAVGVVPHVRRGERSWVYRMLGATSAGLGVLLATLLTWTVAIQRGLDSWTQAPSIVPGLIVALLAGAAVTALAWALQPAQHAPAPAASTVEPLHLAPGERAMWARTAHASRGIVALLLGLTIALVVGAVAALVAASSGLAIWLAGTALLLGLIASATTVFHVRVDDSGLEVRSLMGWPRLRVPLSDVASVTVGDIHGLTEFGGWGLRSAPGATGVILRSGEALRVTRASGRELVVTVDDAATAGALLEALMRKREAS